MDNKHKNKLASRIGIVTIGNIPICADINGANVQDSVSFKPLIDKIPFQVTKSTKKPYHMLVDKIYATSENINLSNEYGFHLLAPLKKNILKKITRIRKQKRRLEKVRKYNESIKGKKDYSNSKKGKKLHPLPERKVETIDPYLLQLYNRMNRSKNKEIYKKRFGVEAIFSILKKFACFRTRYSRLTSTFTGVINLLLMNIAFNRIK